MEKLIAKLDETLKQLSVSLYDGSFIGFGGGDALTQLLKAENAHLRYALIGAIHAMEQRHGEVTISDCAVNNWATCTFGNERNEFGGLVHQLSFEVCVEDGCETISLRLS